MKISVGIITYNRHDTIERCIESIAMQSRKADEIIVIDSSENNMTQDIVKRMKNIRLKYNHLKKRAFQPQARNEIVRRAKGDVIAFVDDDCIAHKHWLKNIEMGYSYSNVVGVGGPCINVDKNMMPIRKISTKNRNRNFFNSAGDIVSEAWGWIPTKPVRTMLLTGGNMSFLSGKLKETGFDEFYMHEAFREETDPQIAMIKKGYSFMYMPRALTYHLDWKTGGIHSGGNKDYYYWCGRNHRYMVDKYSFSRFLSRLSWLTFSRSPPSLPIGILLSIVRRDRRILGWYRGLFSGD